MNPLSWVIVIWIALVLTTPTLWLVACWLWPNGEGRHRKVTR